MAKFTPGPAVAEIRGSVGGTTFSQNRFGAYMRRRSVPTKSFTAEATTAKANLAAASAAWRDLTSGQREAWRTFANEHTFTNTLGISNSLSGHQWFVKLRSRQLYHPLAPMADDPPEYPGILPFPLIGVNEGFNTASILTTFGPAGVSPYRMWLYAAPVLSPGRQWVQNRYRLVLRTDPDPTTPLEVAPAIIARFGDIQPESYIWLRFHCYDPATGHVSSGESMRLGPIPEAP